LTNDGILCVTIDDYELYNLKNITDIIFSPEHFLSNVLIRNNPSGRSTVSGFAICHEYAIYYAKNLEHCIVGRLPHSEEQMRRYDLEDSQGKPFEWENFRKSSAGSYRRDRPKQFFPIYYDENTCKLRLPEFRWDDSKGEWEYEELPSTNETIIYPIDSQGRERVWNYGVERTKDNIVEMKVETKNGRPEIYKKKYLQELGVLPRTWWDKPEYSARDNGTRTLNDLFAGQKSFDFPKAVAAVQDSLTVGALSNNNVCMDFFAGSGTTAHAVINLNRIDDGNRKYILVEMGEYFDSVTKPRIQKVVYSSDWTNGKPTKRDTGISHMFKYIRLESYEDCLNNLILKKTDQQMGLLESNPSFRESYMLGYMLDTEAAGSASLLNINAFEAPFNYKLNIATGSVGQTKPVTVDLVETFNYLLGLKVKHIDTIRGYRVIEGFNPKDEKVLVIWRNTGEKSNDDLEKFFIKQKYNTLDMEFDLIYVNGDNNLENLKKDEDTWKVRLIEEEFQRLMFDVQDV
jgi:adenine-specific DNA-methyltransferase